MTPHELIPISSILVLDRQRQDLGDIPALANSIASKGLIHPIVINQERRLIAGGRRLAAHAHLGKTHIAVTWKETLSSDELHELELEENIRRKEMSWQERCLNIHQIHKLKKRRSLVEGNAWGKKETGELLGITGAGVGYNTELAERLISELDPTTGKPKLDARYWACDSSAEAWRLRLRDEEELIQASLAQDLARMSQQKGSVFQTSVQILGLSEVSPELFDSAKSEPSITPQDVLTSMSVDQRLAWYKNQQWITLTYEQAKELYLANELNPPDQFDSYYEEKHAQFSGALPVSTQTIIPEVHLTSMLFPGSCIDFMRLHPNSVDHIITDPPYGIDMVNLSQSSTGMVDIDTVEVQHTIEGNMNLFTQFFPPAFSMLKENGFLVLWCDIMQWQRLYDLATLAGFKVQRWPITWIKTYRCLNQSANQNFTKSTEIAMVCRKGTATLATLAGECHILAGQDDYRETLGHPFTKPYEIWKYLIDHVSYEGQTIFEPFAGRGSGVLSILRSKRNCIATELEPAHYNALLENVRAWYLTINPSFQFI